MLRLAHHPAMSAEVRQAAQTLVKEIETWNAIVDDYESGTTSLSKMIPAIEQLLTALEQADQGPVRATG
jgi:DNA invertase Pin-like site-specific DNA recombinase